MARHSTYDRGFRIQYSLDSEYSRLIKAREIILPVNRDCADYLLYRIRELESVACFGFGFVDCYGMVDSTVPEEE